FNILLQVLDDGRLTDGQGRTVDFRNTVIIMTSNLGSQRIQELSMRSSSKQAGSHSAVETEADYQLMKSEVMEVVSQHFRPEFINRIDDVVVFHPLGKEAIQKIAKIQMQDLRTRLYERELDMRISSEAMEQISDAGFDPVYGARPLKRAIQQALENPLAQEILAGKFMPGDMIEVDVLPDDPQGRMRFKKGEQAPGG
ncbi:MAG: AAA family ATPase, partial [gamma proteobacterium symbiont of Bathyaustriella thionipta]|nr:AAA family ATPase [gamma proteobacterium symbiont of Bathyaustriella thionipta]